MPQPVLEAKRTAPTGPPPTLLAAATFTAAFVAVALAVSLRWPVLTAFDRERVAQLSHLDARSALFLGTMRTVSVVASTTGWIVVLGALAVWLLGHGNRRMAAFVAVTGGGSPPLNEVLKNLVHRPRPALARPVDVAGGWSFPSAHTQAATVGCAVVLVVVLPSLGRVASRWAVVTALSVVAMVALSRMSLGVHYPSDVAASVLCGLAWTSFTAWVFRAPGARGGGSGRRQADAKT